MPGFDLGRLVIKAGKITIGDLTVSLQSSTNTNYPTAEGWLTFTLKGQTYYIKITADGVKLITINAAGKIVTGVVTQVTTKVGGSITTTTVGGGSITVIPKTSKCNIFNRDNDTLQYHITLSSIFYVFWVHCKLDFCGTIQLENPEYRRKEGLGKLDIYCFF